MSEVLWRGQPISKEDGVPEVVPFLIYWKITANKLRMFQILLGLSATFFSILTATSITISSSEFYSRIFAFISAVSIGLMTAFHLGTKSNNMMDAWRHLAFTVMKFNNDLCDKQAVIDAYNEGEKLIEDVTFQQTGGPLRNKPTP